MDFGYTISAPVGNGFGFGQILPPLSTERGVRREQTNSSQLSITGSCWIMTGFTDNGGGSFAISGDYISSLISPKYKNGFNNEVTISNLFEACPIPINNGIASAYIPTEIVLHNVLIDLVFRKRSNTPGDVYFETTIGDMVFKAYSGLNEIVQNPLPNFNEASSSFFALGIHNFTVGAPPYVVHKFITPFGSTSSYSRDSFGNWNGVCYRPVGGAVGGYGYVRHTSSFYYFDAMTETEWQTYLRELYDYPSYLPDNTSLIVSGIGYAPICCFAYSNDVPDYIEYI